MTPVNRTMSWPATYALSIVICCLYAAGMIFIALWGDEDYWFPKPVASSEVCNDGSPFEAIEGTIESETELEEQFTVRTGPMTVYVMSWTPPSGHFTRYMRSGIAHYSLPPE